MLVLKSVGDSIAITLTINWLASQSMVLKPGPDCTVRLGKPRTGHFYSLFNMKNCSMQKKTMNNTDCGPTAWFCESWLVQVVHTGPLFQALNGTVLDSLPCFFSYTASFGLWNWITLLNRKPSPHSLSSLPLSLTLITSLISASLPRCRRPWHPQPRTQLASLSELSASLPRRRRPPQTSTQITARLTLISASLPHHHWPLHSHLWNLIR